MRERLDARFDLDAIGLMAKDRLDSASTEWSVQQ